MPNYNILHIASECVPFAKVGGLADVVGSLPSALQNEGAQTGVIMPLYSNIDKGDLKKVTMNIPVEYGEGQEYINIYSTYLPDTHVPIFFLENKKLFESEEVYVAGENDGNQRRFAFFNLAVLAVLDKLPFFPQALHLHDWHASLLAYLVAHQGQPYKTVLTIHNLAMQGWWNKKDALSFLGDKNDLKSKDFQGNNLNFMRLGIRYADKITTVSPTYAKEILTKKFGQGLENELNNKVDDLTGILNGINYDNYNPANDKNIFENYDIDTLDKKNTNKNELQKALGLPITDKPLLGVVSRLFEQKGIDWVVEIIPWLIKQNAQLVVLGTGDKNLEKSLLNAQKKYPQYIRALIKFDVSLAQKIYAASDMFLVPSRFEPCGLTQMIAMRYGSVPIVRSTGGLKDTVEPYKFYRKMVKGTGFVFAKENSAALKNEIAKALKVYDNKNNWLKLQKNCMSKDFSWNHSAQEYIKLYKKLIKK